MAVVSTFVQAAGASDRLDTEQEREQELEQELLPESREVQPDEVENFVKREYSREEEAHVEWPVSILGTDIESISSGTNPSGISYPFYRLKDFHLPHQEKLKFDENILISKNFFGPHWKGMRRIKNVVMVRMKWLIIVLHAWTSNRFIYWLIDLI